MLTSIKLDEDAVGLKKFFFYKLVFFFSLRIIYVLQQQLKRSGVSPTQKKNGKCETKNALWQNISLKIMRNQ